MTSIWERSFAEFAGPGIHHPSDTMRVDDDEAATILADLAAREQVPTILRPIGCNRSYAVGHVAGTPHSLLLADKRIVGFYAGSYLWIARAHRGRGLSIPLILAAAEHRGGTVLPPGVVVQGFTRRGLRAHRAAHRLAVRSALAAGLPVPSSVIAELDGSTDD
ncbi:hypothetical protein LZ012_18905 [Dechloromonas sp. XY25]|uniref:GNAT family N-acetyltransferase n=1 Tax=Dechloromonas hankyongensis TaxID=2908002 RepID=A0ABS9K7E2_9RHOO|nr:hypothetical protein [Dechloromonas hankyongensis]MCG2579066.1 hypothetical protein [Dechloromonas hankyongensis]